jgi:hypothetical protein
VPSGLSVGVIVFLSAVGLVIFAAARAFWELKRETIELSGGESWGRQLTSREKKNGEKMGVFSATALTMILFAAGIGVLVLLIYSL